MCSSFISAAASNYGGCCAVVAAWCFQFSLEEVIMLHKALQNFNWWRGLQRWSVRLSSWRANSLRMKETSLQSLPQSLLYYFTFLLVFKLFYRMYKTEKLQLEITKTSTARHEKWEEYPETSPSTRIIRPWDKTEVAYPKASVPQCETAKWCIFVEHIVQPQDRG